MNTSLPSKEEAARLLRKYNVTPAVPKVAQASCLRPVDKPAVFASAFGNVRSQWMDLNPEICKAWLKNNVRNRDIRFDVVKAYARDMKSGNWTPTHQGLAFNDRDEMIDGQHRCHAVILAGVTVKMMVTFGLPSIIAGHAATTMDAVDRGATRSVGDQLAIQHGMAEARKIATLTATIAGLCLGERTRRMSVALTLEVYALYKNEITYVLKHQSKEKGLRPLGVLAAFAFAMDVMDVSDPIEQLFSGCHLDKKPVNPAMPMAQLRAILISPDAILLSRSFDRGLAELSLQALWLANRFQTVDKLEHALDGANYFRSRQPETIATVTRLFALPTETNPIPAPAQHQVAPAPEIATTVKPSLDQLLREAERHWGIAVVILKGRGQEDAIRIPRLALWVAARQLGYKAEEIGAAFPGYDTAKICEAKSKLDMNLEKAFPRTRNQVAAFFTKLGLKS